MDLAGITNGTAQVQVSTLDLAWGKMETSSLLAGDFWLCRELSWKSLHSLVFLEIVVISWLAS